MTVRDALLALLDGESKYGYQLKAEFEAATGEAWSLNIGQVYSTLQRLERDGLVESLGPDSEGRERYELTAAGRAEGQAWFDNPVERTVAARDELPMKVLVAVATGVVAPGRVIATQRASTMTALQDATALKPQAEELAWRLHLDRLSLLAEAELRWLDLVEERLAAPGTTLVASFRSEPTESNLTEVPR